MNFWISAIIVVAALALVTFLVKQSCKPAVVWFVILSASMLVFLYERLATIETFWLIIASILWFVIAVIVLLTKRRHAKVVIPLIIIASIAIALIAFNAPKVQVQSETSNSTASTEVVKTKEDAVAKAKEVLNNNGWTEGVNYTLSTNPENDKSTSGNGAFNKESVKSNTDMVKFLKQNTDETKTIIASVKSATGSSDEQILDAANWVTIQSLTNFTYPGNTSYQNGATVDVGAKDGNGGDIFFLYVAPEGSKVAAVRGACSNPQTAIPTPSRPVATVTPVKPTTPTTPDTPVNPPTDLTPKDPNKDVNVNPAVDEYKQDDIASGNEAGHTVSNEDGASVSNGYQANPVQDATDAAADAANAAAENSAAHNDAVNNATNTGGGVVDSNQGHTVTTDPATTDPNW